jgi:hypothetical protein
MTKKKTVQVTELVQKLNNNLLNCDFQDLDRTEGVAFRRGICVAIEQILFSTGNYQGYRYIDKKEAIKPYAFGCDYSKLTDKVEVQVAAFEGADSTRRQYFLGTIKKKS